jgi:hypothetical protein
MKNFAELYIDFYSKYGASVRALFSDIDERMLHYEILLFTAFVFRQLNNLRGSGLDQLIADSLLKANDSTISRFNIGDYIHAADIEIRVPFIVNFHGNGDKSFYAVINLLNTTPYPTPTLQLKAAGFGVQGKEVNYYALQSINVFLNYFKVKYKSDPNRLYAFCDASNLCGMEYRTGNIGIGLSEGEAVVRILKKLFPT